MCGKRVDHLNKKNLFQWLVLGTLFVMPMVVIPAWGDSFSNNEHQTFFVTIEGHGPLNQINGVGTAVTLVDDYSHFGTSLSTSFNWAEVQTTSGRMEEYFAWEGAAKIGFFSDISLYLELGIDLTELIFHDMRYDHHCCHEDNGYCCHNDSAEGDDIDAYAGIGAGVKIGAMHLEGFYRIREIDSFYWEAKEREFSGVVVSFQF